jgi:hypothetical protein
MPPTAPLLEFAFGADVVVGPAMLVGQMPGGLRRIVPILGGVFEGPALKGRVLSGGADWQLVQADGVSALDTRYVLETDAGELVYVQNRGIRHAAPEVSARLLAGESVDPALVYFGTVPTFESAAAGLQWLMRSVFVGTGVRRPLSVEIQFWRVL